MSAFDPLRGFTPNVFGNGQQQNGFSPVGFEGQGSNESEKATTARSFPSLGVPPMYNPITNMAAAAAAAMQAMQTQIPGQLSPAAMKAASNGANADAFGNFFGTHPGSFYNTSSLLSTLSSAAAAQNHHQNPYSQMNSIASNYALNGQTNGGGAVPTPYSLAQSISNVNNTLPVTTSASPFSDFRNPFAYFMMKPEERITSMAKLSPPQIV